jgi:hypothetical protein
LLPAAQFLLEFDWSSENACLLIIDLNVYRFATTLHNIIKHHVDAAGLILQQARCVKPLLVLFIFYPIINTRPIYRAVPPPTIVPLAHPPRLLAKAVASSQSREVSQIMTISTLIARSSHTSLGLHDSNYTVQ